MMGHHPLSKYGMWIGSHSIVRKRKKGNKEKGKAHRYCDSISRRGEKKMSTRVIGRQLPGATPDKFYAEFQGDQSSFAVSSVRILFPIVDFANVFVLLLERK